MLGSGKVFSQQIPHGIETGDAYYSQFRYNLAAKEYEKLPKSFFNNPKYTRRLVDCYQHLRNYKKFLEWASKAVQFKEASPNDFFLYGQALQGLGAYDSAKVAFTKSRGNTLVDEGALNTYIESCDWAKQESMGKDVYKIENAGTLNSNYTDFSPVVYKDSLYFLSDRPVNKKEENAYKNQIDYMLYYGWTGNPYIKIFSSPYDSVGTRQGNANPSSLFSGPGYHIGPMVFTPNGKRVYFTKNLISPKKDSLKGKQPNPRDTLRFSRTIKGDKEKKFYEQKIAYFNRLEIWFADRLDNGWSEPKPYPYNGGNDYSVGHPAISRDGKSLYFASDMPGGKGGFDLYYSMISQEGSFSSPTNLSNLNTAGDEEFPSIGDDGNLYFASNGRLGFGGLDIYRSSGNGLNWGPVSNLGRNVNSSKDDFGFLLVNAKRKKGYLSSNRDGGKGNDDIYYFEREITTLHILVRENSSLKRIPFVKVNLMANSDPDKNTETSKEGEASIDLIPDGTFTINLHKDGFRDSSFLIPANSHQIKNDTLTLFMDSIPLGNHPYSRPNLAKNAYSVFYNFDKSNLREDAQKTLKDLKSYWKDHAFSKILITSYCDTRGPDLYNYYLSKKRSEAVYRDLIAIGIPKNKIQLAWFGFRKITNHCKKGVNCTEEEHQQNRRSEIKIIEGE